MSVLVAHLDPDAAGHLVVAIGRHRAACERQGLAFPPALADLEQIAQAGLTSTQERSGARSVQRLAEHPRHADDPAQREWLTADDVARLAGVSVATVRRWIADDRLPSTRAGRARRIRRTDLDHFMTNGS